MHAVACIYLHKNIRVNVREKIRFLIKDGEGEDYDGRNERGDEC